MPNRRWRWLPSRPRLIPPSCPTKCARSSAGCWSISCAYARSARGCRGATGRAAISGWSARPADRTACSRPRRSIRSTPPSSTSPMVQASTATIPMSAPCCIPALPHGPRRWQWQNIRRPPAPRCWPLSLPDTRPSSALDWRCSRVTSNAVSRAPAPATVSAPRPRPDVCCFPARTDASPRRWALPEDMPAASRSFTIPAHRPSAYRPHTRPKAASLPRFLPSKAIADPSTSSKAPAALPALTPTVGIRP